MFRKTLVAAVALATVMATPALAAPGGPTGTIELAQPAEFSAFDATTWPQYGDTVGFAVTVDGKVAKQARLYVTVVCSQGSTVVYQRSGAPDAGFPLEDGQGLEWDGGASDCSATLIYRVDKGKNTVITHLDSTTFDVAGF